MMSYSPSRASLESEPDDDDDDVLGNGESTVQSDPESNNNRINGNRKKGKIFGIRLNFGLARIRHSKEIVSRLIMIGASLRGFSYSELRMATDGFSSRNKIGSGGCGDVYRGWLKCSSSDSEMDVAVKAFRSDDWSVESCMAEMQVLNELRHSNVVRLIGWGQKGGQVALVYEYLPNDNLYGHLHGRDSTRLPLLSWNVRYWKIALGLARALLYIQEGLDRCVIHGDVKSSNVFLDSDFNPKLGDFGLAKRLDLTVESYFPTQIAGTLGYIDPDCVRTGCLTSKSDIYNFGVVALEIATGRKVGEKFNNYRYLLEWVHGLHEKGDILKAADPRLGNAFDRREMEQLLMLGLLCTNTDPNLRPSASLILRYLNFEEQMPLDPNFCRFSDDLSALAIYSPQPNLSTQTPEKIPNHKDSCCIEEAAAASWIATFDIGIPPHYYNSTATTDLQRQDYHLPVLYGMVDSLAKMLTSRHEQPTFDKVLATIRTFTASLVNFVPPPLDDWDALAQLILKKLSIKESSSDMENYNSWSIPGAEASLPAISSSSLEIEIEKSALTIEKDEAWLKDTRKLLARKREDCSVLEAKLQEAREICRSIEEEAKAIEQRVAPALATLEQKRRLHAIIKRFESALSPL